MATAFLVNVFKPSLDWSSLLSVGVLSLVACLSRLSKLIWLSVDVVWSCLDESSAWTGTSCEALESLAVMCCVVDSCCSDDDFEGVTLTSLCVSVCGTSCVPCFSIDESSCDTCLSFWALSSTGSLEDCSCLSALDVIFDFDGTSFESSLGLDVSSISCFELVGSCLVGVDLSFEAGASFESTSRDCSELSWDDVWSVSFVFVVSCETSLVLSIICLEFSFVWLVDVSCILSVSWFDVCVEFDSGRSTFVLFVSESFAFVGSEGCCCVWLELDDSVVSLTFCTVVWSCDSVSAACADSAPTNNIDATMIEDAPTLNLRIL